MPPRDRRRRRHRRCAARVEHHFGPIAAGDAPAADPTIEPEQTGERRRHAAKEGTTAYLKVAYHAPAARDAGFFPALVLDAVLTGAKGINLWSSFRVPPPQRRSRLYRALVDTGLASSVSGSLMPTEQPFLYTVSATATVGHAARSGGGASARVSWSRCARTASPEAELKQR